MDYLKEILNRKFTAEDLKTHCRKLGFTPPTRKEEILNKIIKFYEQPGWLEEYYKSLRGYELEYTDLLVKENFYPIEEELDVLRQKYNIKYDRYSYRKNDDTLKYSIFGYIPEEFKETLLKLVPPVKVEFTNTIDDLNADDYYNIINEDDCIDKFDNFVMFVNKNKVKVTEKNEYVTKSGYLKFIKEYPINDYNRKGNEYEIRTSDDTIVFNGIVGLLKASKVIIVKTGYLVLGPNYKEYIKLNKVEKAKMLFEGYLNSKYDEICELERPINCTFLIENKTVFLKEVREYIINYIKLMPINKWITTYDLFYMIRIKDVYFLRKYVGDVECRSDYENWYYSASFETFDLQVVDSILMDYLAVLGIIDVTLAYHYTDFDKIYVNTEYIKLNDFGAIILGLKKEEKTEEEKEIPLSVTKDHQIIVNKGGKRMEYELYFERFFELERKNTQETIYKMDFKGFAKALDLGIDPNEIIDYLLTSCIDIPKNILEELLNWTKYLHMIKIRTVKILECPIEVLDQLLESKKISSLIDDNKNAYVIIKNNKSKELKKAIESQKYFCEIED